MLPAGRKSTRFTGVSRDLRSHDSLRVKLLANVSLVRPFRIAYQRSVSAHARRSAERFGGYPLQTPVTAGNSAGGPYARKSVSAPKTRGTEMTQPRIVMRATAELRPYAKNPRTHSRKQIDKLARSLSKFGFVNPVIIDKSDNIVAGHARHCAVSLTGKVYAQPHPPRVKPSQAPTSAQLRREIAEGSVC